MRGYPELLLPQAQLKGRLSDSHLKRGRRSRRPVDLCVRPLPPDLPSDGPTSSLHYWSFRDGLWPPLSSRDCHDLGLPAELTFMNGGTRSLSVPTNLYKLMHEYQLLRGFDPATTDFAQHLGYNVIFQPVVNEPDRFQDIV